MEVKFMYNGIKVDGKLYKAWYFEGLGIKNTISICASGYCSFPKIEGLQIKNDSDIMTDYFEKDQINVTPDNKYYNDVLKALEKNKDRKLKKQMMKKLTQ